MTKFIQIDDSTTLPAAVLKALSKVVLDTSLKHRHVAVVTYKGIVTGVGVNTYVTHTEQARWAKKCGVHDRSYLHAEIGAMLKSKGKATNLYVVRVNNAGKFLLSKPCIVCSTAIIAQGLKNVYYS